MIEAKDIMWALWCGVLCCICWGASGYLHYKRGLDHAYTDADKVLVDFMGRMQAKLKDIEAEARAAKQPQAK